VAGVNIDDAMPLVVQQYFFMKFGFFQSVNTLLLLYVTISTLLRT